MRSDFVYEVMFLKNTPVDVTVRRDGKSTVLHDVSFPTRAESGVTFGNAAFIQTAELSKNAPEVLRQSFFGSLSTIRVLWTSLLNTVKGEYGTDAISGPVGVIWRRQRNRIGRLGRVSVLSSHVDHEHRHGQSYAASGTRRRQTLLHAHRAYPQKADKSQI